MPRRKWSLRTAALLIALALATGTAVAAPWPTPVPVAKAPGFLAEVLRWVAGWIIPERQDGRAGTRPPAGSKGNPASADLTSGCGMDPNGQPCA